VFDHCHDTRQHGTVPGAGSRIEPAGRADAGHRRGGIRMTTVGTSADVYTLTPEGFA